MSLGTLVIFSGLPGSGKSTLAAGLASRLRATYLRIDTIEQGLRDVCGIAEIGGKGYALAHRIAQENLRCGTPVIADSVNPWRLTRAEWNNVAKGPTWQDVLQRDYHTWVEERFVLTLVARAKKPAFWNCCRLSGFVKLKWRTLFIGEEQLTKQILRGFKRC